jgi:hypothetical protein
VDCGDGKRFSIRRDRRNVVRVRPWSRADAEEVTRLLILSETLRQRSTSLREHAKRESAYLQRLFSRSTTERLGGARTGEAGGLAEAVKIER